MSYLVFVCVALNNVFSIKYANAPLQEYTSIIQEKIPLAEFDVQFMRVSTVAAELYVHHFSTTFASSAIRLMNQRKLTQQCFPFLSLLVAFLSTLLLVDPIQLYHGPIFTVRA